MSTIKCFESREGYGAIFRCLKSRTEYVVIAPTIEALRDVLEFRCGYRPEEIDMEKVARVSISKL